MYITVMHEETQRVDVIPLASSIRECIVAAIAIFELRAAIPEQYLLMDWNKKQEKKQMSGILWSIQAEYNYISRYQNDILE